jgi:hypothetical protein
MLSVAWNDVHFEKICEPIHSCKMWLKYSEGSQGICCIDECSAWAPENTMLNEVKSQPGWVLNVRLCFINFEWLYCGARHKTGLSRQFISGSCDVVTVSA